MKTPILLLFMLPIVAFTQILDEENFEEYPLGPVNTDLSGETFGTNNFYVFGGSAGTTSTNVNEYTLQFAEYGDGQALQLIGPNGNGGFVTMYNDDLLLNWGQRDEGNDILIASFDVIQDTNNGGHHLLMISVDNFDFQETALVAAYIDTEAGEVFTRAYYDDNGEVGNYYFATNPPTEFVPQELTHIDMSFNFVTGQVEFMVNGNQKILDGAAAGIEPRFLNMFVGSWNTNTSSDTFYIDNILVTATNNSLGTKNVSDLANSLSTLYPNPAKDILHIKLGKRYDAKKTQVIITDMTGRKIATLPYSETINTSFLKTGTYVINISDGKSSEDQKLIKK